MPRPLPEAVAATIDKLQDLEAKLDPEQRQTLFSIRRLLQHDYHDFLKQGTRIKIIKELQLECPECGEDMMDSDHIYLHMRQVHGAKEEEAAKASVEQKNQHEADIETLGKLLGEYTEVLLEENFD